METGRRGFQVRVWPGGAKTFVFRYGTAPRRVLTLGTYPDLSLARAHKKYDDARAMLADEKDPITEFAVRRAAEDSAGTVQDLFNEWHERYAKKERKRPEDAKALFDHNATPAFRKLKAKDVTRRTVIQLLDGVTDRSPSVANHFAALLMQVFRFGVERDFIAASPIVGLQKPGAKNKVSRERTLSDEELKIVWAKLPECAMSQRVCLGLKFLLLTAQRRGETSLARWADIDFAAGIWTIPAENSKTGERHAVPLSPLAVDLLEQLRALTEDEERESPFVFPTHHSVLKPSSAMTERAFTRAVRENAEVFGIPHFVPHDFRRTARTAMAKLGIADVVAERVLNHKLQGMLAVYNRYDYLDEKREALCKWAAHVQKVVK